MSVRQGFRDRYREWLMSSFEALPRVDVAYLSEQPLFGRSVPPEAVETHQGGIEVHLGADEAVRPGAIDAPPMPQELDRPEVGRAPEEDHAPSWPGLEIPPPQRGKRTARGCGLDAGGPPRPERRHVARGAGLEHRERAVMEPRPDLGLPPAIVALDRRLKASLPRGREDRDDAEAQTQPAHPAERIGELMRALEAGVVVELGIARHAARAPVLEQQLDNRGGAQGRARPGRGQAAVQREPGEHLDVGAAGDDEAVDDVEAIELHACGDDRGQVPAQGRGRAPHPAPSFEGAAALQDAADGPDRGHPRVPTLQERLADGDRAELPEVLGSYLGPEFVTAGRSAIFSGPSGTGRTHLSFALAIGRFNTATTPASSV